jgi:hypothetical protein
MIAALSVLLTLICGVVFLKITLYIKKRRLKQEKTEQMLSLMEKEQVTTWLKPNVGASLGHCPQSSLGMCISFSHGHGWDIDAAHDTQSQIKAPIHKHLMYLYCWMWIVWWWKSCCCWQQFQPLRGIMGFHSLKSWITSLEYRNV